MVDLFCGLGGWASGGLAEGYHVVGFDIEQHAYGEHRYPGHLVIQDVLTLHGSQFRDAALIVASPPCQEYSYMAMPWKRAKAKAAVIRADKTGKALADLTRLFDACFRIQREASDAAGHTIPLVVENVRGAIPWVGRSRWNFGSYHLWGDVPALMPSAFKAQKFNPDGTAHPPGSWFAVADSKERGSKVPGFRFDGSGRSFQTASVEQSGVKAPGMNWSDPTKRGQDFTRLAGRHAAEGIKGAPHRTKGHWTNPAEHEGVKQRGSGAAWFDKALDDRCREATAVKNGNDWFGAGENCSLQRRHGSKSTGRKAASAMIAKIPFALSRHIAATFKPQSERQAA